MVWFPVFLISLVTYGIECWVLRRDGRFQSRLGLTGCEVARHILDAGGASQVTVEQLYMKKEIYEGRKLLDLACAAREAVSMTPLSGAALPFDLKRRVGEFCRILVLGAWTALLIGFFPMPLRELQHWGLVIFVMVFGVAVISLPAEFEVSERAHGLLKDSKQFEVGELARLKSLLRVLQFTSLGQIFRVPAELGQSFRKGRIRGV